MTKYIKKPLKNNYKGKFCKLYYGILACMKDDEIKIKNYLLKLGFQPNLKGYKLLSRLIEMSIEGTKILPLKFFGYEMLSREFGVAKESHNHIFHQINRLYTPHH